MTPDRYETDFDDGFVRIPPGARLADWQVLRALGQGHFGRVYEAAYAGEKTKAGTVLPARAALKVFDGALLMSPVVRAELSKEARAMESLSHPNILGFYGEVTVPKRSPYAGTRFFVLELGDNDLLADARRSPGGLPAAEVLAIAVDMAAALRALHEQYVHGDMKPENIIRMGARYKLADMGVAARLEGTGAYPRAGTLFYRPPEYGRSRGRGGKERVRRPYDLWGLGITLHEVLTGRHPYQRPGENLDDLAIFRAVQTHSARWIDVGDPALREVIEHCLEEDEERRATAEELLAILDKPPEFISRSVTPTSDEQRPAICNIQTFPTSMLQGRSACLHDLRLRLHRDHVVALVGPDGAGKTELALAWAHRQAGDYDVVWRVGGRHPETMWSDCSALAEALELGAGDDVTQMKAVRQWLADHERWLLVFEDVTSEGWRAAAPTPNAGGHILLTTATPVSPVGGGTVDVDRLDRDHAVALLLARSGDSDGSSAVELAEALGDLPLALELAAAFVATQGTLAEYIGLLRRRSPGLFGELRSRDRCEVVTATCRLSLEQVEHSSQAAADLLRLCAMFAPDANIPLGLLNHGARSLPKALQRSFTRGTVESAMAVLQRFSLAHRRGDGLTVHRLVQSAVSDSLGSAGRREWAGVAVRVLDSATVGDKPDHTQIRRLLPHVLSAVGAAETTDAEPDTTSGLLERAALHLSGRGQLPAAKGYLERAITISESAHGPDDVEVSERLFALASLLRDIEDYEEARNCCERSLSIARAASGPNHPMVAARLHLLGQIRRALGDYDGAIECLEAALTAGSLPEPGDPASHGPEETTQEAPHATNPEEGEPEEEDSPAELEAPTSGSSTTERRSRRKVVSGVVAALTLVVSAVGLATRPAMVPEQQATVVMAIDVSLSMEATDLAPSRSDAVKGAAKRFLDRMPNKTRVGLVSFSGSAAVVVPPTTNHRRVSEAITQLALAPRTAIGEAIFASLASIAASVEESARSRGPGRIVLVSDGETTVGRPNDAAADAAAEAKVPVSTIALGTDTGAVLVEGRSVPVPVNRDALRRIAESTKGRYFQAESHEDLDRAYDDAAQFVAFREARQGVSARVLGIAVALALVAGAIAWLLVGTRGRRDPERPRQGPFVCAKASEEPAGGELSP